MLLHCTLPISISFSDPLAPFALPCSYSSKVGKSCTVHPSHHSRGKLRTLNIVLNFWHTFLLDMLTNVLLVNQVILCTKEVAVKARSSAFTLLIECCNASFRSSGKTRQGESLCDCSLTNTCGENLSRSYFIVAWRIL